MSRRPQLPDSISSVDFPRIPRTELVSGIACSTIADPQLPKVSVQLGIPVGRIHDPEPCQGVVELAGDTLKEGTRSRTSREIAETFDRKAISFHSEVFLEYSVFSIDCLRDQLEPALELFADILVNPAFPESELAKARARWQSILIAQRADAGFLANERFIGLLFPDHPYGRVAPPAEQLPQLTSERLGAFYDMAMPATGAGILFAGDVEPMDAGRLAADHFGGWRTKPAEQADAPGRGEPASRVVIVDRPHSAQAKLVVGMRALERRHPDFDRLRLANQVLGGGGSARLFLKLREQKGYSYGVYSSLRGYRRDGILLASCSLRADKTGEAAADILDEMRGLQTRPPGASELGRCKAEIIGSFLRRVETPASIGSLEISRTMTGLPEDYYQTYVNRIQAITPEDVRDVAAGFIRPEDAVIVAVGKADGLEPQLREFGDVAIFDTRGERID